MITIDPKVLYRFEVRVCEEIFAKRGFGGLGPFGEIRNFVESEGKNIPERSFN